MELPLLAHCAQAMAGKYARHVPMDIFFLVACVKVRIACILFVQHEMELTMPAHARQAPMPLVCPSVPVVLTLNTCCGRARLRSDIQLIFGVRNWRHSDSDRPIQHKTRVWRHSLSAMWVAANYGVQFRLGGLQTYRS